MSSEQPPTRPIRKLSDPRAMRAVAHPTRLALLEAFDVKEPLTATEAAELIGESPTNCAFHLRTLAKYGFIEEAGEAPGRRRPWRRTHVGFSVNDRPGDPVERRAAYELSDFLWTHYAERLRTIGAAGTADLPEHWRRLTQMIKTVSHVTPDEAQQLLDDVAVVLDRYRDRLENPSRRPAEDMAVEWVLFSYPRDLAASVHDESQPQ